jgi:hypothetical protein
MRSRLLMLFLMLLLVWPGTLLAQGKGQAKDKATAPGQEVSEQATTAEHGKAHKKQAKKKGAKKGKKEGQEGTNPGKNP